MSSQHEIIPFFIPPDSSSEREYPSSFKWSHGTSKYEIHATMLQDIEIGPLLTHCLSVKRKIDSAVSIQAHRAQSYFSVFPRTLSTVLLTIWDQLIEDLEPDQDEEGFEEALKDFIAAHCTDEDRKDLAQQLSKPKKPLKSSVQEFNYRLQQLNSFIDWMPGTAAELDDDQLKQAFYDGMPDTWKTHFVNSGDSVQRKSRAELSRYFRNQEKLSRNKQRDNEQRQRDNARKNNNRNNESSSPPSRKKSKRPKTSSPTGFRNDGPCPVHPDGHHNWEDCFHNPANAHKKRRFNNNDDKSPERKFKKKAAHATEIKKRKVSYKEENGSDNGSRHLNEQSDSSDGECFFASDFTIHENDLIFSDNVVDYSQTQTLDEYHCHFMKVDSYCYKNGEDMFDMPSVVNVNDELSSLKLRPTGVMVIDRIQKQKSKRPLKVLFDPGSDITFVHRRCLPNGAVPSKLERPIAIGTVAPDRAMHENKVTIQGIRFPEFTSTSRIDMPATAVVMDADSTYDVILGLDILIPLGIDVSCSTKTVTWNNMSVPFRPANYFKTTILSMILSRQAHTIYMSLITSHVI